MKDDGGGGGGRYGLICLDREGSDRGSVSTIDDVTPAPPMRGSRVRADPNESADGGGGGVDQAVVFEAGRDDQAGVVVVVILIVTAVTGHAGEREAGADGSGEVESLVSSCATDGRLSYGHERPVRERGCR